MLCLLKTFRDLHMLFATATHLIEGLSSETLLTIKLERSLIFLVRIRRPTVSITEQQLIVFLKSLIINKASRFCRME
jgi:hypothetical protein